MSVNVVLNGVTFQIPDPGDNTWGQELTDYFVALGSGVLQKSGGAFTLTAEVNFGATYGLKSAYFKSRATNPSATGQVRLGNTEFIGWRNAANDDDMELAVDSSDRLTYNGNPLVPSTPLTASRAVVTDSVGAFAVATTTAAEIAFVHGVTSAIQTQIDAKLGTTLASARLLVGSGSNLAVAVDITGDVSISNTGVTAIGAGKIVNSQVNASAAIDFSKLAALTSAHILVGSSGDVAVSVSMSGDVTISNTGVTAIGSNKVTLGMMAQISTATFLGRTTASTGNVEDLTATQATALLSAFVGDSGSGGIKGLVPAPASGDAAAGKFLKASGGWATPSGSGDVVGPASAHDGGLVLFNTTTGKLIKESTITQHNMLTSGANGTVSSVAPGSAGNVAVSDGTDWTSASLQGNATALKAPTVQVFASGSGTYTKPTGPAPLYLIVEIVGGGAGGGGSGTTAGTAATDGADSTFSVHSGAAILTAGKGVKGARGSDGGAGGTATVAAGATKIIAVTGGSGGGAASQNSGSSTQTPSLTGGQGGSSFFGGAGGGGSSGGSATGGAAGTNTGSGGGGGSTNAAATNQAGSGGGSGAYIKALVTTPSSSYDYAVGAKGTAGTAGTSGNAGGDGGSGYLVVTEYYQ